MKTKSSGWVNKRHYNFKLVLNSEEQGSDLGNQPNTLHRISRSVTTRGETAEFCHRFWSLFPNVKTASEVWETAVWSEGECGSETHPSHLWLVTQFGGSSSQRRQHTSRNHSAVELVHVIMTSGWWWGHQKGIFEAEVLTRSRCDSTQEPSTCLVTV